MLGHCFLVWCCAQGVCLGIDNEDCYEKKTTSFSPPAFSFEENWILDPPSRNFPTVHFRHHDAANVAFLDGHVETRERHFKIDVPGTNFMSTAQADMIDDKHLGYVSEGHLDDPLLRDELYDRQ